MYTPSQEGEYKHTTTCTNSTTIIPYMVMQTPSVPCLHKLHFHVCISVMYLSIVCTVPPTIQLWVIS